MSECVFKVGNYSEHSRHIYARIFILQILELSDNWNAFPSEVAFEKCLENAPLICGALIVINDLINNLNQNKPKMSIFSNLKHAAYTNVTQCILPTQEAL